MCRNGCIDWFCWQRFDSEACFAALLGTASLHGLPPAAEMLIPTSIRTLSATVAGLSAPRLSWRLSLAELGGLSP